MHIQHDGIASAKNEARIVETQVQSYQHDTAHNAYYQDDVHNHQHSTEVDVSLDSFVKKVEMLNFFVFLLLIFVGVLYIPRLLHLQSRYIFKSKLTFLYNLFQPPLRAPPGNTFL